MSGAKSQGLTYKSASMPDITIPVTKRCTAVLVDVVSTEKSRQIELPAMLSLKSVATIGECSAKLDSTRRYAHGIV